MEDLIKRSDVWNITAILHSEFITIEQEQILERIDEMVDGLPSADRPQGEWIETDMRCYGATVYKCSVCGDDVDEMPTVMGAPKYRYCPNCGARMKGADDYERAIEQMEHDMLYEPTYNSEDGSM